MFTFRFGTGPAFFPSSSSYFLVSFRSVMEASKSSSTTMQVSFVCQRCSQPLKLDTSFNVLDRVTIQELIGIILHSLLLIRGNSARLWWSHSGSYFSSRSSGGHGDSQQQTGGQRRRGSGTWGGLQLGKESVRLMSSPFTLMHCNFWMHIKIKPSAIKLPSEVGIINKYNPFVFNLSIHPSSTSCFIMNQNPKCSTFHGVLFNPPAENGNSTAQLQAYSHQNWQAVQGEY